MFALLSFAGVSLVRRNLRRTILTTLAVACATLVFCIVMVLPYITDHIVEVADSSPRLVVMNKSAMRYGLPESYSLKVAKMDNVVAVNRMTWFGGVYDDPKHHGAECRHRCRHHGRDLARRRLRRRLGDAAQGASQWRRGRSGHHASVRLEGRTECHAAQPDLPGHNGVQDRRHLYRRQRPLGLHVPARLSR